MDKKTIIKNIIIVLFVIVCAIAYFKSEADEAKQHSQGAYERYQEEQLAKRNAEEEQSRINELYDMAAFYEDVVESPYDYIGCETKVYGNVASISLLNDTNGRPSFIDIGETYPSTNRFTVVVWGENYEDVSIALQNIGLGDTIFVEGVVEMYDGVPQIEVTNPGQIHTL